MKRKVARKNEVLFDEARQQDPHEPEVQEQFEDVQPLGEELVDTLVDLLFYTNFTLPPNDRTRSKVTYSIWQSGVGCNTHMNSSSQLEGNRCEVLRLLLTMSSEALYMSPSIFAFFLQAISLLMYGRCATCKRDQSCDVLDYMS